VQERVDQLEQAYVPGRTKAVMAVQAGFEA
jgi:hypothetical protein